MKKYIIALIIAVLPVLGFASEGGAKLEKADVDLNDTASLQRGARLFVNYCLSCHSANYMRYSRMAKDLGLSDKQVANNLMFASDKVGSLMTIAMRPEESKNWFGNTPPDLSVEARARGADWLYTYLKSFYLDPSRPFGVNNVVFKDVAMPDVLWELHGLKEPIYKEHKNPEGKIVKKVVGLKTVQPGTMTDVEYDRAVRDLVNFLVYMGEPAKLQRPYVGFGVLLFLALLFVVSYYLKKEYWKDIH
ncbi:MAG: cytochrome c1 [Gammaproteobacteria bacterium]|nr:cytochrome c1 [Gammaproteobacteria bacterium]